MTNLSGILSANNWPNDYPTWYRVFTTVTKDRPVVGLWGHGQSPLPSCGRHLGIGAKGIEAIIHLSLNNKGGMWRSIPQCMILDVQAVAKSSVLGDKIVTQ